MTTVAETQVAGKGRLEMLNAAPFDHPVHFTDLDGLRGILALSVVLLHYGINAAVQRVSHGHLAGFTFQLSVDFFFILSGFVLAYSMREGRVSVPDFAVKRIFRLMPVHFFCLAILLLISAVAPGQLPYLGKPLPTSTVVADLVLATPIIWPGRDAINVPSWSVGWELYLPILAVVLAPIMAPVARRFGLLIVLLGCCALSFTAIGVAEGGHLYGVRAFLGLSTGACLYGVAVARSAHLRGATTGILYALIAGMLVVMLVSGTMPYVAALFPWLAVFTVLCGTRTRSLLSSGPIAWLGEISYTLYMVHIPVFVGVALLVGARLSGSIPLKGAAILLALLGAHVLTRWVERPAMALGRRLRGPPRRRRPMLW
jgi:peptidoglycan/LPS O-acetylase OafA/YrhL